MASLGHNELTIKGKPCEFDKPFNSFLTDLTSHSGNTCLYHYNDVIMSAMESLITIVPIGYSTVFSAADQWKHQSSVLLTSVWGIHWWPVNCPHKGQVTRKMFPFDFETILFWLWRLSFVMMTRDSMYLSCKTHFSTILIISTPQVVEGENK